MDLKRMGINRRNRVVSVDDRDYRRALVKVALNLCVSYLVNMVIYYNVLSSHHCYLAYNFICTLP
jgi:hypothetical protein